LCVREKGRDERLALVGSFLLSGKGKGMAVGFSARLKTPGATRKKGMYDDLR